MKNLFIRLKLWMLKNRLRKYRRDEKFYKKISHDDNYYTSCGIPNLEKQIADLEKEIL